MSDYHWLVLKCYVVFNKHKKESWSLQINGNSIAVIFENGASRNYTLKEFPEAFPSWIETCKAHIKRAEERKQLTSNN